MKKLYEILGQQLNKGDVGIEIEVEGRNLTADVDPRWNVVADGSLRGESYEYVLRKPLPIADVRNVLEALAGNLKDAGSKLDFSFRTSVHVHINCQDLTYTQYLNMLYTYFLLEEPFMTFCGKERKGNRFCLRLQDAEGMLDTYNMLFRSGERAIFDIPHNAVRYSAMNIEATQKYGSLEFRGMRGNLDVDYIEQWVGAIYRLREFARGMNSPTDVYNLYAELEAQGFLERVLGEVLAPKFYYARMAKDIQKSFSLSLELPFSYGEMAKKEAEKAAKAAAKAAKPKAAKPKAAIMDIEADPFAARVVPPAPIAGLNFADLARAHGLEPRPAVRRRGEW